MLERFFKSMYLSLKNTGKKGIMLIHNWSVATNQFAIMFEGRIPVGDSRGTNFQRISDTLVTPYENPGILLFGSRRKYVRLGLRYG
jgi:hypothetical protein